MCGSLALAGGTPLATSLLPPPDYTEPLNVGHYIKDVDLMSDLQSLPNTR
jgi:hypothetical protein